MDDLLMDRLKQAKEANDVEAVFTMLGEMLDGDFEQSAKWIVVKSKVIFKGRLLWGKWANHFWASDIAIRFAVNFAEHPVYQKDFWRSYYRQKSWRADVFSHVVSIRPDLAEIGVRRNSVFRNPGIWQQVKDALRPEFVEQCERVSRRMEAAEKRMAGYSKLLSKKPRETFVVHFAIWLEQLYFAASDEAEFDTLLPQYFEILEETLRLSHQLSNKRQSREFDEINEEIGTIFKRMVKGKTIRFDTFRVFEAVDQLLQERYHLELFTSHGWLTSNTGEALESDLSNRQFRLAWDLASQKFHAADLFEAMPWSIEDEEYRQKCLEVAPNQATLGRDIEFYFSMRFLSVSLGEDFLEGLIPGLGFNLINALQVMSCNKFCYASQFIEPRAMVKKQGGSITKSCKSSRRFAIEARTLEGFVGIAAEFEGTASINRDELSKIYQYFSANIHDAKVNLSGNMLLNNGECQLLLTRYFSGDLKTYFYNSLFEKYHRTVSQRQENRIGDDFKGRGFNVVVGHDLLDGVGEIDIVAYRENTLFLIEAKVTYARERASEAIGVLDKLNEGSAQLHRVMGHLSENWDSLRKTIGAPEDLSAIQVLPLLVHNSLEYDHCYFDGILKVSEFELHLLFSDIPDFTHRLMLMHQQRFAQEKTSEEEMMRTLSEMKDEDFEEYRMFEMEKPTIRNLIDGIEESRFWRKVLGRDLPLTPILQN